MRRQLAQQGFGADGITTVLTGVLLFIVLFYVYPMKFLFTTLFDQMLGDALAMRSSPGRCRS